MATATILNKSIWAAFELLLAGLAVAIAEPALYESRQVTPSGEYTFGIEGPAVDAGGTLYVVNFQKQGTIGMLPAGASASLLFVELPEGSVGNGIRFDRDGRMYVADYKNHNVLLIERGQKEARIYFHSDMFNQPNDLTVAADGTLYASDPNWKRRDGQIWRITRGGRRRGPRGGDAERQESGHQQRDRP